MFLDLSREEVGQYLEEVKQAVRNDRYRVSPRGKNEELYVTYILSEAKCKEILLELCVEDFSEAVHNEHPSHPEEVLYIFGKNVQLLTRFGGEEETVALYIKFNKLANMYVIVISFHKQQYPLNYKFK